MRSLGYHYPKRPDRTPSEHILIATDCSELAAGFELARQLGAQVTVVTVTEPWTAVVIGEPGFGVPVEEYEKSANESVARTL